jgi:hypothetical protein
MQINSTVQIVIAVTAYALFFIFLVPRFEQIVAAGLKICFLHVLGLSGCFAVTRI